jgi:hypothetical protein
MAERNEIDEELRAEAPLLASLARVLPFDAPENYFSESEDGILVAAGLKPEARVMLNDSGSPFTVPDQYFEDLPAKVILMLKSGNEGAREVKIRSMGRRWWWAAASVAVIILISLSVLRNHQKVTVASAASVDTTFLLLESAAGLPDAMVVDLYWQEQEDEPADSLSQEYLREAAGIDMETIYSL